MGNGNSSQTTKPTPSPGVYFPIATWVLDMRLLVTVISIITLTDIFTGGQKVEPGCISRKADQAKSLPRTFLTAMGKGNYSNFKGTIQKKYTHWPCWQINQNEERLPKEDYFPLALQLYLHCNIIFTKMNMGRLLLNTMANTKLFELNIVRLYLDAKGLEKTFHWKLLELIGWDVGQPICRYCRFPYCMILAAYHSVHS